MCFIVIFYCRSDFHFNKPPKTAYFKLYFVVLSCFSMIFEQSWAKAKTLENLFTTRVKAHSMTVALETVIGENRL